MSRLKKIVIKLIISFVIAIVLIYIKRVEFFDIYGRNGVFHTILSAIMVTLVTTICIVYTVITVVWYAIKLGFKNFFGCVFEGELISSLVGTFVKFILFVIPFSAWFFVGYYLMKLFSPDVSIFEGLLLFVYFSTFLWIDLIRWYIEEYR